MLNYIDPGTGSMLFTILVGLISAGGYKFKDSLVKARFLLSGGSARSDSGEHPNVIKLR